MKLNVIIDGNNFLYKSYDVTKYAARLGVSVPVTEKKLGSPEALELFKKKIDYDVKQLLNSFGRVDNVFIVQDAGSWRKTVKIDGRESYKENRVSRADEIDWDNVREGTEHLFETNPHYVPVKVRHLEGDDLVYLIVNHLENISSQNINIIVSTDGDFNQLVSKQTMIFNFTYQKNRFIVSKDFDINHLRALESNRSHKSNVNEKSTDDVLSMFDVSDVETTSIESYESLADKMQVFNMEKVESEMKLLNKILCGDDKDDVPSSYTWEGKKRSIRITDKYSSKLFSIMENSNIPITLESFFSNLDFIYSNICDITKQEIDKQKFIKNLEVNRILLYLSTETIPENLVQEFNNKFRNLREKYGTF